MSTNAFRTDVPFLNDLKIEFVSAGSGVAGRSLDAEAGGGITVAMTATFVQPGRGAYA